MSAVRVGVWGVGAWGEKHARVYAALPSASLVGVFDRNPERARAVAAQHGTRAFATPDEMLGECEAVSIATATVAHREALEHAAAAGRHALVEKPLAGTLPDADAMIAAAQRARVTLQTGHVERFNPAFHAVRPALKAVKFVEAHRLALFQPRSLDIDVVFDLMIHDVDLVLSVIGREPSQLSAVGVAVLSDNEDIANARLEFDDGCVANLTASRVSQERLRRIRFFQDDAYISIDLLEKSVDHLSLDRTQLVNRAVNVLSLAAAIRKHRPEIPAGEPLALELDAVLRSLRGEGGGAASGADGRAALAVAEQVRDAMKRRTRQWAGRASAVS